MCKPTEVWRSPFLIPSPYNCYSSERPSQPSHHSSFSCTPSFPLSMNNNLSLHNKGYHCPLVPQRYPHPPPPPPVGKLTCMGHINGLPASGFLLGSFTGPRQESGRWEDREIAICIPPAPSSDGSTWIGCVPLLRASAPVRWSSPYSHHLSVPVTALPLTLQA